EQQARRPALIGLTLPAKPFRVDDVVAGHHGDVFPPAGRLRRICGPARPLVRLVEVADARIGKGPNDLARTVGRAVIDHHRLKVSKGLAEDAGYGLANELFMIVGDDGHAYQRLRQAHSRLPPAGLSRPPK